MRQCLQSRWFAPNALKHFAQPDSIHGVYLPFWTYDTDTTSYYTGERGDHYYLTETHYETDSDGREVARTRQVQHTSWSTASGRISRWFDDILVPATASLAQNRLEALEPWDLAELRPYEPAFLSGFKAQRYQVDLAQGFERVRQVAATVIQGDARQDIGGNVQRIHNVSTHYSGITFKHLLLPVYAARVSLQSEDLSNRRQRPHWGDPGRPALQSLEDRPLRDGDVVRPASHRAGVWFGEEFAGYRSLADSYRSGPQIPGQSPTNY